MDQADLQQSPVSSRYIFKPIFHSFWLTHMLVNLPLQGPLCVYLCLACPLPSIAIGSPCTTTLIYQHLSSSPTCNSITMHYLRPLQDYLPIGTVRAGTLYAQGHSTPCIFGPSIRIRHQMGRESSDTTLLGDSNRQVSLA